MKHDYVPTSDGDTRLWADNLKTNIGVQGPLLGLTDPQVNAIVTACTNIISSIDYSTAQRELAKSATANKDAVKEVNLKEIRNQVAVLKRSNTYTHAIGQLLAVEGTDVSVNKTGLKPTISAAVDVTGVVVKFNKQGMDGVNVYGKTNGQPGFIFLARDTHSPYLDTRPKQSATEERQYYAVYVEDDKETGLASDIITIVL